MAASSENAQCERHIELSEQGRRRLCLPSAHITIDETQTQSSVRTHSPFLIPHLLLLSLFTTQHRRATTAKMAESSEKLNVSDLELDQGGDDSGLGPRKGTVFGSSANLIKAIIGSGILGLPSAFAVSGWVLSSIVLAVSAFINALGLHYISRCALRMWWDLSLRACVWACARSSDKGEKEMRGLQ